tara:strand:- start:854 stop:1237 length:384 start_codon:yes stop_codon:yes gene_type:complete
VLSCQKNKENKLEKDNIKTDLKNEVRKVADLSYICDCAFYMMQIMKEQNVSNPKDVAVGNKFNLANYESLITKLEELETKVNTANSEVSEVYSHAESADIELNSISAEIGVLKESILQMEDEENDRK